MRGGCTATPVLSALYWELAACSCMQVDAGVWILLAGIGLPVCFHVALSRFLVRTRYVWIMGVTVSPRMENHMEKTIENDVEFGRATLNRKP